MEGSRSPTFMDPAKAAEAIRTHVDPQAPLTIADAAAKAGLALRDAESGLAWLSKEYRGQLRVTSEGQLVHLFPSGFTKPWEVRETWERALGAVGRGVLVAVRLVVRAWVAIVLVGYVAIFVALVLALALARQGNDSRRSNDLPGGELAYGLMRVVSDALFWTFRPWSPFSVYAYGGYMDGPAFGYRRGIQQARGPRVPFYERVNRFFFGPQVPPPDPLENERRLIAAIRAGKGRIGLADVMRVTGFSREHADPLMAKLMLDYEGDVSVSEDGGIVYAFPALRKSASEAAEPEPPPAWSRQPPIPPLTGNSIGANFGIMALNGFNLLMSLWAIENGMTIERVSHLFDRVPYLVTDTGTPLVFGVIPFIFSTLLFVVPLVRLFARPFRLRKEKEERGRLAVLRTVIEHVRAKEPVMDGAVRDAWQRASGIAAPRARIDRELVALGGDIGIAEPRWRFAELETEAAAVEAEREAASEEEARLGEVVFASDK